MRGSIVVFQPPGKRLADVERALRARADDTWDVFRTATPDELAAVVADNNRHHLAVVPEHFTHADAAGLDLVRNLRQRHADLAVVVLAEAGSVDSAARAIEAGASEYLVRGPQLDQRIATLLGKLRGLFDVIDRNRLLDDENVQLRESLLARFQMVGQSPAMRALVEQIRRVAAVPRPVLIVGERGTGKELVARAIHVAAFGGAEHPTARPGAAATRPMVTVNCAAFHDALLESELFGHEKGAFTGADATRRGRFEQADGGTLFLDEIGHMSLPFQQKILRVVEYGAFTRVGGVAELRTTARIIAATNCDLIERIRQDEFLADLYDRLSFEVLRLPSLRERLGDVAILAQHFLNQFALETPAFRGKTLSKAALAALENHHFAGNVRELKNLIERAAYRDTEGDITPDDLGLPGIRERATAAGGDGARVAARASAATVGGAMFTARVDDYARRLLADALTQSAGNQAQAARTLGLSYHQFRYYHKKLCPMSYTSRGEE